MFSLHADIQTGPGKRRLLLAVLAPALGFAALPCTASNHAEAPTEEQSVVSHKDPINVDPSLNLAKLIDLTLEKYPDASWLSALEEEADALRKRGESWTAGSAQAAFRYQEATSGTLHYLDATVQVPLWNIGQRTAEQKVGERAEISGQSQAEAVKLRVTGLIRSALWDMALQKIRYEQAQVEVATYEQLLAKIKRRVDSGDLPRSDELLAQTELLQKRSALTLAEAELMHSRKRYSTITQTTKIPANYQENLAVLTKIQQNHPALAAVNNEIERKRAELEALKLTGSGQPSVIVGINSDDMTNDPRSNKTESFNIGVDLPFGGSAHIQPKIAAVNVELNKLIAEREQLYRNLEQMHHEAEHNLEVNRAELDIANELKRVAEEHLNMTELSFSVGEIDLMDLLRVQSRTNLAILNAKERAVMLQRDQALYNQAVGVMP